MLHILNSKLMIVGETDQKSRLLFRVMEMFIEGAYLST
jgi:hypothetical protein